ncbi:hypothetical protein DFW61_10765 [Campylobacter coli]|nr:hypothetical protein [Campylobacter coli]
MLVPKIIRNLKVYRFIKNIIKFRNELTIWGPYEPIFDLKLIYKMLKIKREYWISGCGGAVYEGMEKELATLNRLLNELDLVFKYSYGGDDQTAMIHFDIFMEIYKKNAFKLWC